MSTRQGDEVARLLASAKLPWNRAWRDGPVATEPDGRLPAAELWHGMRITLLSPRPIELGRLGAQWAKDLASRRPTGAGSAEDAEEPIAEDARPRQRVVVVGSRKDSSWSRRIQEHLAALPDGKSVEWLDWDDTAHPAVVDADLAVVLVSPAAIASKALMTTVLPQLLEAVEKRRIPLTWVLLEHCPWQSTPLARYQALQGVEQPLDALVKTEGAAAIDKIAHALLSRLASLPGKQGIARRGAKGAGPIDVEALANTRFVGDRTVANAASIAFLAEFHDGVLLVGGDARAEVLAESIRTLLQQRSLNRLRVDAFVIPHGGSARNMSRELLEVLECDRYLISTSGEAFNHPDRETIARILTYGRARADSALTLVFNYRTKSTEIWADSALQERYRYKAIYPEGSAGIKLGIL